MKNEFKAPHVVNLSIPDKATLHAAYMPWVKQGGLFFASRGQHRFHEQVLLSLDLMNGAEKLTVTGQVVWITPRGASGKRAAGIGVQFSAEDEGNARTKIETLLAGVDSNRRTHTM
jgi:type IV pilus assembly protein PilZ